MKLLPLVALLAAASASPLTLAQSVPAGAKPTATQATPARPTPAIASFGPPSGNPPPHPGRLVGERFQKADVNHDGKVSLGEAKAGMPVVFKHFSEIDSGKSGAVTLAQVQAYFQQARERNATAHAARDEQRAATTVDGKTATATSKPAANSAPAKP